METQRQLSPLEIMNQIAEQLSGGKHEYPDEVVGHLEELLAKATPINTKQYPNKGIKHRIPPHVGGVRGAIEEEPIMLAANKVKSTAQMMSETKGMNKFFTPSAPVTETEKSLWEKAQEKAASGYKAFKDTASDVKKFSDQMVGQGGLITRDKIREQGY